MWIISILLILFLSVSDIFFYRIGWLPAEPSVTLLPVFFTIAILGWHDRIHILKKYRGRNPFLVFLIISIVYIQFGELSASIYVIGNHGITFLLFFTSGLFFLKASPKEVFKIFLVSFLILGGSILYDMFAGSSSDIRGAGFAENPNNAALRLIFLLIAVLRFVNNKRVAILFSLASFLLVFLTLSRSGVIILLGTVFVLLPAKFSTLRKVTQLPIRIFRALPVFIVLLLVLSKLLIILPDYFPAFEHRAAMERIQQISGKGSLVNDSDVDGGRINIFKDYLELYLDNIMGYGTGYSLNRDFYDKATHNMFLRFAIDYGIIGVVALFMFLYRFLRQSVSLNHFYMLTLMLAGLIACFFTHSLFENRTFIIVFSFLSIDMYQKKINYKT